MRYSRKNIKNKANAGLKTAGSIVVKKGHLSIRPSYNENNK